MYPTNRRRTVKRLAIPFIVLLSLAACGTKTSATTVTTTVAEKQLLTQAQTTVQGCVTSHPPLTDLKGFESCVVPPGAKPALTSCVQNALLHGHYVTAAKRRATEDAVAVCVEQNR